MTDEKYVFVSDVREKKTIARSARNARTHNGKGGRVKLPSDYLSKKELEAMNGPVESYKLNSPMTWKEFKAMPDNIKMLYLQAIRKKWDVPFAKIGEMLGVSQQHFARETKRLGLVNVRTKKKWDAEGFYAWVHGVSLPSPALEETAEEISVDEIPVEEAPVEEAPVEEAAPHGEDMAESAEHEEVIRNTATPISGNMVFECPAHQALSMMAKVLGNVNVLLSIKWDVLPNEGSDT